MYYGYARISTESQNDTSLEVQIDFLRRRAEECEMVFKKVLEKGSGTSLDTRPNFIELLGKVKPGDVVGVYDNSRFGRNTEDNLKVARELGSRGVIIDVGGKFYNPSDPSQKLMFSVESSMSTYFRDSQNLKAREGHRKKRDNGDSIFSGKLFGWNLRGRGKNTWAEVDETASKVVRYIFDEYIKGRSVNSIFRELASKTIVCENPRRFVNAINISDILMNPIYMGYYLSEKGMKHKVYKLSRIELSEMLIKSNKYSPIVSEETWWKAFESRKDNSRLRTAPVDFRRNQYECSTVYRCASCGYVICHSTRRYGNTLYSKYFIPLHTEGCKEGTSRSITVEHLDMLTRVCFIVTFLCGGETSSFFSERKEMLIEEVKAVVKERKALQKEIEKIQKKQKALYDFVAKTGESDVAISSMNEYNATIKDLKAQIEELGETMTRNNAEVEDIAEIESELIIKHYIEGGRRASNLKYMEYGKLYDDRIEIRFFNGKEYIVHLHELRVRKYDHWDIDILYKGEPQANATIYFDGKGIEIHPMEENDSFDRYVNDYWKGIEDKVNESLSIIY